MKRKPSFSASIRKTMIEISKETQSETHHNRLDDALARTEAELVRIRAQPNYQSLYAEKLGKVSHTYMELCCDKPQYGKLMAEGLKRLSEVGEQDSRELITILGYLGLGYLGQSQFEDALQLYVRVYQIQIRLGVDDVDRINTLNEMSILYRKLEKFQLALDYTLQALDIAKQNNDLVSIARTHNNLCLGYTDLKKYDSAIVHGEDMLSLERLHSYNDNQTYSDEQHTLLRTLRGYTLNNLGVAWMQKGMLSKAKDHFDRGLAHNKKHDRLLGQIYSLRGLGNVALQQEQHQNAIAFFEEAVQLSQQIGNDVERIRSMQLLATAYAADKQHEKAYHQHQQFHDLFTHIHEAKRRSNIAHWQTRLETEVAQHNTQIMRLKNEELEALVAERTADVLQALEQSEKTNTVRSNMIKTIMHEFRTPLTVVSSSSSLLRKHAAKMSPEKQAQIHTRITDSIQYLSHLLSEVSKVENSSTGNLDPSFSSVNIGKWSKKLCDHLRRESADPSNVTYVFDADDETTIEVDTKITKTIVSELLTNALKYTPDDKPITVEIGVDGDYVVIIVSDEGMGIAADEINKIYELFYRAYKAGDIPGLGTGLYMVKAMVTALNGELDVESAGSSLGTIFYLKLPKFNML